MVFDNRVATAEAQLPKPLQDARGAMGGIFLTPLFDCWFEGIRFAAGFGMGWGLRGLDQILRYSAPADVKMLGDLPHRPLLNEVKPVNRVDLLVCQHR